MPAKFSRYTVSRLIDMPNLVPSLNYQLFLHVGKKHKKTGIFKHANKSWL